MSQKLKKEEKIETPIQDLLRAFPRESGFLIPLLQKIQETLGYLPREAMEKVATHLGMPEAEVYGVATFYNQFRFHPPGKHPVKVCMGTACHVKAAGKILEKFERLLNIKIGQTTPDLNFGLDQVRCLGCCGLAPVVTVGQDLYGKVTLTKLDQILKQYQKKGA